ncbi:MAG: hypothetical protein Q9M21_05085 [Mariprofundaceae bacterium]|nr:hypothetical protein [Mariprofundaceae bacterium]
MSFGISYNAYAGGDHQHMHGDMKNMGHNPCDVKKMTSVNKSSFLEKQVIDGYDVSFHIMKAPEGMEYGGTHHVMMKVEKNNETIVLKAANSKITHPNGNSESKMMMKMGDWYMAGYNLDHEGEHKIMVLFKTEDGLKHFGGIVYSNK